MKIRTESKFGCPITVQPGDTIALHHQRDYIFKGEIIRTETTKVLESEIKSKRVFTKGVIFDIEESDGLGGTGIGGAFIQEEETRTIRLNVPEL